jgi:hypothetical protein
MTRVTSHSHVTPVILHGVASPERRSPPEGREGQELLSQAIEAHHFGQPRRFSARILLGQTVTGELEVADGVGGGEGERRALDMRHKPVRFVPHIQHADLRIGWQSARVREGQTSSLLLSSLGLSETKVYEP